MSASHDAKSEATHEIHPHPPMPAVHDEAADSPTWLPVSGIAIVILMVLFAMMRTAMQPPAPEVDAAAEDAPVEANAVPAPTPEAQ